MYLAIIMASYAVRAVSNTTKTTEFYIKKMVFIQPQGTLILIKCPYGYSWSNIWQLL